MNFSVRIVLVGTTHAGNIGAVARAMKNMGFTDLCLVNPCKYRGYEAYARASGANDIIDNAKRYNTLPEALIGCSSVFGTSARTRNMRWEDCSLRNAVSLLDDENQNEKIAFVFGTERSGLTNEELSYCHRLIFIPTNANFPSLNLAAAVQLVVYELSLVINEIDNRGEAKTEDRAIFEDMEKFYHHLESTLVKIKFLDLDNPRLLMRRLRRLYNRSRPTKVELNILRGILSATEKKNNG